ncbi:hypothetical protein B0H63DRAFT_227009 [Podospora didyma]|uniref:Uncharacterized protein n=1 Tax=Podospora didyma TaxID=330526 RepID=A0AAE0KJA8_9PEZI|nr:hypothetical protein B0H63DRAFT_227009 [Podospora didyma]
MSLAQAKGYTCSGATSFQCAEQKQAKWIFLFSVLFWTKMFCFPIPGVSGGPSLHRSHILLTRPPEARFCIYTPFCLVSGLAGWNGIKALPRRLDFFLVIVSLSPHFTFQFIEHASRPLGLEQSRENWTISKCQIRLRRSGLRLVAGWATVCLCKLPCLAFLRQRAPY